MNAWQRLAAALRGRGARPALRDPVRSWSAADVLATAERAGRALRRAGFRSGEAIAVHVDPTPEAIATLLATWCAELVALPLHPADRDQGELLQRARCRALIATAAPATEPRIERAALLEGHVPDAVGDAVRWLTGAGTLLTTSGSSGPRKLVAHRLERHLASADGMIDFAALREGDAWLLPLPLHHVGGLAVPLRTILAGATTVLPRERAEWTEALAFFHPSHASVVATQLVRALSHDDGVRGLGRLRLLLGGGGPFAVPLRRWALGAGVPLAVGYGCTEAASTVTAERDPHLLLQEGRAGKVLPGRRVRVDGEGRIEIGGATMLDGYAEDGVLRPACTADGWLRTGDVGRIDDDGLLVLGRADAMFFCGGENVQPERIEAVLGTHPAIAEVVVVPRPDVEYGARPVAFVMAAVGTTVDVEDVFAFAQQRLAPFEVPVAWYELPAAATLGIKRDRRTLARLVVESADSLRRLR